MPRRAGRDEHSVSEHQRLLCAHDVELRSQCQRPFRRVEFWGRLLATIWQKLTDLFTFFLVTCLFAERKIRKAARPAAQLAPDRLVNVQKQLPGIQPRKTNGSQIDGRFADEHYVFPDEGAY